MKTLIAKEIRLLLPAFLLALLLVILPAWLLLVWGDENHSGPKAELMLYTLWFSVAMLALASFGREFGLKTFPLLLSQPLDRRRMWRTKTTVLGGLTLIVIGVWTLAIAPLYGDPIWPLTEMPVVALVGVAAAYSGGLWAALLLRQVAAAFWFTVLAPVAILMVIWFSDGPELLAYLLIILYSIGGFLWAGWLFSRAQEVAWTGGLVDFSRPRTKATTQQPVVRVGRPWRALLIKELQLHAVSVAGIGALCLMHLGVLVLRRSNLASPASTFRSVMELFGGLWFFVPLIVASVSVAEERKLGTLDELLTLPVSVRRQFLVKLAVGLGLGGIISALCLWTIEGLGTVYGASANVGVINMAFSAEVLRYLVLIHLALALIGFYASTLTHHLVQAMAASAVATMAAWILWLIIRDPWQTLRIWLWDGLLGRLIVLPVMAGVLAWLAYGNFRHAAEKARLWWRNVAGLLGALGLVIGLTTSLYHRAWEYFTPLEPAPGPARWADSASAHMNSYGGYPLAILLPDGRLRVDLVTQKQPASNWLHRAFCFPQPRLAGLSMYPGSNWVSVMANKRETIAIRSDGTLWVSEKPNKLVFKADQLEPLSERPPQLIRADQDTHWQQVAGSQTLAILLRDDGTLWRWGTWDYQRGIWPGFSSLKPQPLDGANDWQQVMRSGWSRVYAWKKDGQAWAIAPPAKSTTNNPDTNAPEFQLRREPRLDELSGIKWVDIVDGWPYEAGLRENGTVWIWKYFYPTQVSEEGHFSGRPELLSRDPDWKAITSGARNIVGLKNDGSMWQWTFSDQSEYNAVNTPAAMAPSRLGTHHDWLGVASLWDGTVSLAADGSLWYWYPRNTPDYGGPWNELSLLSPSRRPLIIGSVMTDAP
jgi:hypothetical protein